MNAEETQTPSFREIATNSIRYWERARLVYNGVLTIIVVGSFLYGLPKSFDQLNLSNLLALVVLAVLANVCYCAAYPVDVFVQYSGFRLYWLKLRWLLFLVGLLFASIFATTFASSMFRVTTWPDN